MRRPLLFLILLSLFALFTLTACRREDKAPETKKADEAMAAFIAGYSGGLLSADGPIRVKLVNPVPVSALLHQKLAKSPLEFSPSIPGSAVWVDSQTLEFRPAKRLERGKRYDATLRLDRILQVPEALREFTFGFTAMEQFFEIRKDGFQAMKPGDPAWQKIEGMVNLADAEPAESVEKMLSATFQGRVLPVNWEHLAGGREHVFRIDSMQRGEEPRPLILKWEGRPLGVKKQESDTLVVPSIHEFKVLSVEAHLGEDSHVLVRFSDPPQGGQDFRGLVEIADQGGLRYQVDGNTLRVYSRNDWQGAKNVEVNAGLRNAFGKALQNPGHFKVAFEEIKPGLRFVGKGVIMPGGAQGGKISLPIEAVNLSRLQVTVTRIYAGNMPQFLQVNDLESDYEMQRVGRRVLFKTIALNPTASMRQRWTRYALDLTELLRKESQSGVLYRITLSFKQAHSTYPCSDSVPEADPDEAMQNWEEDNQVQAGGWDGVEDYYNDYEYNWEDRDNPCKPSYYKYGKTASRNVLASNIGLMAKAGLPGKLVVVATDLLTALPLPDTDLEVLNFQHQVMAKGKTDAEGFAEIGFPGKAFLLRAARGEQRGYLKVDDKAALQMGQFDVGGMAVQQGLKGFLFGERGVWRPGDSLFLTFILEDKQGRLPAGHPVSFELRDPQGHKVVSLTRHSSGGFYSFATATAADAPTGNYSARVKAGPAVFEERLKIETVVPNRLKIRADFSPSPLVRDAPIRGNLQVSWLSGAKAGNLAADVEMTLVAAQSEFPIFTDYAFSDPARVFAPETQNLFEGRLDEDGRADFSHKVQVSGQAPGALRANFRTRVMEAGGGFSVDRFSEIFHPYAAYVGMKLPPGDKARGMLLTDTTHRIKLALLNAEGGKMGRRRIGIKLYKLDWRWWWDKDQQDARYLSDETRNALQEDTVALANGEGFWPLKINHPDWGRYLLRACDLDGGPEAHCTGRVFYMDWPGWAGRAEREGAGGGAAVLAFSSDKAKYSLGEKIRLTIPSPKGGRALISIEKGAAVIKRYWLQLKDKETVHEIPATAEMTPNVYVYAALLQPHGQTENDLPMRMYNVIPIQVEDPATRLRPELSVHPAVFRPGEKAAITVSEAAGKSMHYVLAVVDEGLLDLTRFATPDPWQRFYAREALGIKTWDLFDFVSGAHGDRLERLLSIGGDEGGIQAAEGRKGNRFPPMVRFLGPFTLDKGKSANHGLAIPQYVGSVRVMAVAGRDGAYGMAEKAVPVRKPLMVLGVLPRSLATGETLELPISVFAMEKGIRDVEVAVSVSGPLVIKGQKAKTLTFSEPSDELLSFALETREAVGWTKIRIQARSGGERAEQTLEVEVRNPNSRVTEVQSAVLQPGGDWSQGFAPLGVAGTNRTWLEISRIPPLDLGKRLDYLLQYPHGCVEQVTSAVFPQLALESLLELSPKAKADIERNVKAGIQKLRGFQASAGGFGYWPGDVQANDWASSYAGHFLLEAGKKGYGLPEGMVERWAKHQSSLAQSWKDDGRYGSQLDQAYRLYTLALAGSPEIGAMNRLKENAKLNLAARWQLGGAYQLAGQGEVAKVLVQGNPQSLKAYAELDGTFGSDLRDKAMMLDVLCLLGKKAEATPLMETLAASMSGPEVWSTQTTAYSLLALARFTGSLFDRGSPQPFAYTLNGAKREGKITAAMSQIEIQAKEGKANALDLKNSGPGLLYARLIHQGIPALGQETEASQGLDLRVEFQDMLGLPLDPAALEQGKDFAVTYRISHPGGARGPLKQLALTAAFPSGWEIRNTRIDPVSSAAFADKTPSSFDYQDFRDDRVHTYFQLAVGEEKVFRFFVNAAYLGHYRLPQAKVEAMYDAGIHARSKGMPVAVVASQSD